MSLQGLLEGYLLTGRHGLFTCYEVFIHIVDAMFNCTAREMARRSRLPWRRPIASPIYLLHRTYGVRTTTDSRIRIPDSSTSC